MLFTDEILEKILTREDVSKVPLVYQSAMIHAIKEVLEEEKELIRKTMNIENEYLTQYE